MIQALFFLRFKSQLHRTRPQILAGLEDAFVSAARAAGGRVAETHRFLSASFDENRIGFLIDMLLFAETLKKNLEETGRELSGHAVIIGEDIPEEGRERLCRALSSGTVSRFSGIWYGRRLRKALEPYAVFEDSGKTPCAADETSGGGYMELKELVKSAGQPPQFTAWERIGETLLQKDGNVLLAGPPFTGKLGGVYYFCENLIGNIPPLVIRAGSGNPAYFADALTDGMRFFLIQQHGGHSKIMEELDALAASLFRERMRSELFPALLDAARRFLRLLLAAYYDAVCSVREIRSPGAVGGPPVVILKDIPVSNEIASSLFREVFSGFEKRQDFLVFGICSLQEQEPNAQAAFPATQFADWGKIFPRVLKFSSKDFPAREKPAMPPFLAEAAYTFALLGQFFPPRLFPRLFEEEGLNPNAASAAAGMLNALGLIETPEENVPGFEDFLFRAEQCFAVLEDMRGEAGFGISGKENIRKMVKNRILAWIDSGKINPCFALLGILDEFGGGIPNALILRIIREDVYAGTYRETGEFAEHGGFAKLTVREGGSALLWIFKTLKSLVWEDEKKIEESFSFPPPECAVVPSGGSSVLTKANPPFFAGFSLQILVNLGAYKLGRGELEDAAKIIKEAMLLNQSLNDRAVSAYRLFSLVNLARNRLADANEYAMFTVEQAEKTAAAGKNTRREEFEEQIKAFYFAAVVHFLYGNLSKAEHFAVRAEESACITGGGEKDPPEGFGVTAPGLPPEWAAKARFLRGRIKFEYGAYDEALELFCSLTAGSPEGPSLFMQEPSDRDRTVAAWIYRAQVFSSLAGDFSSASQSARPASVPERPAFPGPDGQIFMAEAAFLAGNFEKALSLAEGFLEEERRNAAADESGGIDFFFTEQPDWRSGFSQCESVILRREKPLSRFALVYRTLAKTGSGLSENDLEDLIREWHNFYGNELLPDGDPGDSFYYYAYYYILEKTGASRIDTGTVVSMAFKRLQRRAGRIEKDKTRQSFVSMNYWNRTLSLAAKEYKLI